MSFLARTTSLPARPLLWGLAVALPLVGAQPAHGQRISDIDPKDQAARHIDERAETYARTAQAIWDLAEVGYQEHESSGLLQGLLSESGFRVEAGVAGMPTAFVAEWGSGEPVIALMGEFDALPGINQDRVPERLEVEGKAAGHACGHHMFGTGSVAAALAVQEWLQATGQPGTVRMYGTPAEEGGAGKVYMVRAGLFDDVDAMLHWHPSSQNNASPGTSLANKSAKFRFSGVSAHAAGAPERGRSALDGVEAMNHMVNLMREHVPQETRIHYVITQGGHAPNVIPDFAEVFYYVRNPDSENVKEIFERVAKAAEGAALGTGTTMEYEVIHGIYSLLPNEALAQVMHRNLSRVGGITYTDDERAFAEAIQTSFPAGAPPLASAAEVAEYRMSSMPASTDVGDVSTVVPTAGLSSATWVPGILSRHILPEEAIVDPTCTYGLPRGVVAASAFDMVSHAIEAYTARQYTRRPAVDSPAARVAIQGANPWSDMCCREALNIAGRYLVRSVTDASDREARDRMSWGATLAGIGFGNCGTHAPHAMGYPVASLSSGFTADGYPPEKPMVPHGYSVIVNSPSVFRFTAEASPERHLDAATLLGGETRGAAPEDAGEAVAGALIALMKATEMPNGIGGLGYGETDVADLAHHCRHQRRALNNAPRDIDDAALAGLYAGALSYW